MNLTLLAHPLRSPTTSGQPTLLHEYFQRQALARPFKVAVDCNGVRLTYGQLDILSNQIAHWLRERGVGPHCLVGICLPKSHSLYAAILGVLKAGAGYVPIDPSVPADRFRYIVSDAEIGIVICSADTSANVPVGIAQSALLLDANATQVRRQSRSRVATGVTPADVCYVIYTSGSTGQPKGVLIEHKSAVNFVRASKKLYDLSESDRVYQGFSVAFDASVEEIWNAFAAGSTLVVPRECVAKSPFDTAAFLTDEKISFFSTVPTFLAMIEGDLPTVKVLVVGGEQCSSGLVDKWAPGRRMLNTYGPTETTVVATAAECRCGKAVTIGKALPGYSTFVLDEHMQPVAPGQMGELYVGGPSVARGYVNQPKLSAERFIVDGREGNGAATRLFRTHDIVRLDEEGELQFVGRSDQQVKIRGFRVELSEIEAVILEEPSIKAACVNTFLRNETIELAAYVVSVDEFRPSDRRRIAELLRRRLPEYMIPRYLEVVTELPLMISGKIDRKLLADPRTLLSAEDRKAIPPATPSERAIVDTLERLLGISPVFASDDFFRDLGGHSHAAARVVTELRKKLGTTRISVRDIYEHRTAANLAAHFDRLGNEEAPGRPAARVEQEEAVSSAPSVGLVGRWLCAICQACVIFILHAIVVAPVLFIILLGIDVLNGAAEWWRAAETASTFALFVWPGWLAISIAVKWIVIGRYKPGRYPIWGSYYLRWWIVRRFQSISWCGMFVGTPLMSLYYAAMGADVGPNCTICTPFCAAFDLVTIGKGSSIGADTHILGYRVEDGCLILDRVAIGDDCFVGVHCSLGLNVVMSDGARLDDMSMLPDGSVMAKGEARRGSPAAPGKVELPVVVAARQNQFSRGLFGALHLGLIYVMGYLLILGVLPGVALVIYFLVTHGASAAIISAFAAVPLSCLWWLLIVLLVKKFAIGRIQPGTYSLTSSTYLRIWFLRYLLDNTRHLLTPIYATMFTPLLLRWLGAKIGRGVEISTLMHVLPDLLELGKGSFLADGCIVGGLRVYRGWIDTRSNKIGDRTFVGNSALAPPGVDLGNNALLGVLSIPPAHQKMRDGARWLGSPSFELPVNAPTQGSGDDETRTFHPTISLVLHRTLMELLRMLLPSSMLAACLIVFVNAMAISHDSFRSSIYLIAPFVVLFLSMMIMVTTACLKWVLMGVYRPSVNPLWCSYVWRNEIINGLFESLAANVMSSLLGTPFASHFLRMMGCHIGRWVYLDTTLFSEFDLVNVGDYAALNLGSTIQTHLFEDRVMKAEELDIGEGCAIGNMSVILYGVQMGRGAKLGPLSLLMKGETLPPYSRWHGIPTEQVRDEGEIGMRQTSNYEAA